MATKTDYYDDEDSGSPHKDEGKSLTMLSKSVFGGKSVSPGDKITLVIKKVHDDEVSVEFTSSKDDELARDQKALPDDEPVEPDEVPEPESEDLYA